MTAAKELRLQGLAGARAMGLLISMVRSGRIPACHMEHAKEIIAAWPVSEPVANEKAEAAQ